VLEILRVEQDNGTLHGVIVQFGGQTPLKLANALHDEGIPILGTTPDAIDLAEDRERFQQLLHNPGPAPARQRHRPQPRRGLRRRGQVGYPLVIRPSFVLGGRAMEIVRDDAQLERYIREAVQVSGDSPVLLDSYLSGAIEVDVDALCDGTAVHVAGIMEHIEEAGVHSGDSACCLPPHSLSAETIAELKRQTVLMARALNVVGLMNVQFAIKDGTIYVLEVNPRASRTVPFVAKATDSAIASIAARLMAGEPLSAFPMRAPYPEGVGPDTPLPLADPLTLADPNTPWFSVKEAVLPFARFPGVDPLLGPEMRSTGEVMGWDRTFARAFLKAQMGAGTILPERAASSCRSRMPTRPPPGRRRATWSAWGSRSSPPAAPPPGCRAGRAATLVNKVYEGRPNIVDRLKNGDIALVMNTTEGAQAVSDSRDIRRVALMDKIPYFTTAAASIAAVAAMKARHDHFCRPRPCRQPFSKRWKRPRSRRPRPIQAQAIPAYHAGP
jgi:carbamoyl-phosphate synthase large subunit